MGLAKYRLWCETEGTYVFSGYVASEPTECPNNAGHTINPDYTILISLKEQVAPTSNDDISAGYVVGSVWVDEIANQVYISVDDTEGSAVWRLVGGTSDLASGKHHIHVDSNNSANSWKVLTSFIFLGTSTWGFPASIKVLAKQKSGSGTIRIYDLTNDQTVATKDTIANSSYAIIDVGTLSNLPVTEAVFEIQGKKVDIKELVVTF